MKGTINRDGTVTIIFNHQEEKLVAPGREMGFGGDAQRQWLPCEACGAVNSVAWNVVTYTCDHCIPVVDPETEEDQDRKDLLTFRGYQLKGGHHSWEGWLKQAWLGTCMELWLKASLNEWREQGYPAAWPQPEGTVIITEGDAERISGSGRS